ncbi:hypothetical protein GCM10010289_36600 [Streptomyces violascens]|nr:hypothetical protein GCM10010289_36600 [Streptomyces violascens]
MSNPDLKESAPVGQTSMQFPQYTHAESVSGASCSAEIRAPKPRPATAMADVFCHRLDGALEAAGLHGLAEVETAP